MSHQQFDQDWLYFRRIHSAAIRRTAIIETAICDLRVFQRMYPGLSDFRTWSKRFDGSFGYLKHRDDVQDSNFCFENVNSEGAQYQEALVWLPNLPGGAVVPDSKAICGQ